MTLNEDCHAHDVYNYFRAKLQDAYEEAVSSQLDFLMDQRMAVFKEVTKTPILLSLLIVVLGAGAGAFFQGSLTQTVIVLGLLTEFFALPPAEQHAFCALRLSVLSPELSVEGTI